MTAPMRSTPHASALPASQTAPVAEFRCLFTHDVRRKQKRWQDGYLKFHTFNNRVMVCDQARNHVGDTYWKDSNELHEGDELSLDKGVLVEVAEAMGITQTDLAPLFERKPKEATKEPPARTTSSVATRPFQRPSSVVPSNVARNGTQLRHKSLNTLLGTPKGPVGKAQPMKSPYEARKEKEQENDLVAERAPKRQKTAQRPGGWRASSPVHEEESPPAKTTPLWARTADTKNSRAPQARMPPVSKVMTISSESDRMPMLSSDVTLPDSPAKVVKPIARPPMTSAPTIQSSIFDKLPPVEPPKHSPTKIRLPKAKPAAIPKRPAPDSSPPVSASNRLTNVDFAVQTVQRQSKEPSPKPSPPRNPKAKSLRLSVGVKRGTLLCQSLPQPASRARSEPRASGPKPGAANTFRTASKDELPASHESDRSVARAQPLPKLRLLPPFKDSRRTSNAPAGRLAKVSSPAAEPPEDSFDDPELIHGLMDQQLLIPSSPAEPFPRHMSPPREAGISRPAAPKPGSRKSDKVRKNNDFGQLDVEAIETMPPVSKSTTKNRRPSKKTEELHVSHDISPAHELPSPPFRDVSPAHTDASGPTTSSKSPTKPLLSTGGFRKKPKRIGKEGAVIAIPEDPPQNVTVPLPPHQQKGPLMSTTELASLLQKPRKRSRKDDPIEDASQASAKSPARKIRRVRSENDAPIPSTAEDWEKRNLPKPSSNLPAEADVPTAEPKKKHSALAALVKRTDPRKKFQRTKSLSVETNEQEMVEVEIDLPSPIVDKDVGPWSTEAGDLFDWRPPNRDEECT